MRIWTGHQWIDSAPHAAPPAAAKRVAVGASPAPAKPGAAKSAFSSEEEFRAAVEKEDVRLREENKALDRGRAQLVEAREKLERDFAKEYEKLDAAKKELAAAKEPAPKAEPAKKSQ